MNLTEFDFVRSLQEHFPSMSDYCELGIGDDAALLDKDDKTFWAISTDTFVGGVHFREDWEAKCIAHRILAASLSDLAAMGAEPACFTLNVTSPKLEQSWWQDFIITLSKLAKRYNVNCIGGDTTQGPLSFTVTVFGIVSKAAALRRSGARSGDIIYVSGELGYARFGLDSDANSQALTRLYFPEPKIELGAMLAGHASAAIDISDGFLADLNHILLSSKVGAKIDVSRLPGLKSLSQWLAPSRALDYVLSGGDDYELCFTIAPSHRHLLATNSQVTEVGMVIEQQGMFLYDQLGAPVHFSKTGYQHFEEDK